MKKKNNSTKKSLVMSAISLVLCVAMLMGTTFAWFTDSVTSSGNIIKSGTLDVTMEWKDATKTGAQQNYKDASAGAIFNYDLWEPGYVEAKNIKISNVGTLALKYNLYIAANGEVSELADVIDVYFAEGEYTLTSRAMTELTKVGTLSDILEGMPANMAGDLEANTADTVTIALKMQEDAGNEYQGLEIGSDFSIILMATQYTSESDSFNNQYDANAKYDVDIWNGKTVTAPVADADGVYHITTAAELVGMMNVTGNSIYKGKTIVLDNNIDLGGRTVKGIGGISTNFAGVFDGQGYTISNFKVDSTENSFYAGLFNQVSHGGTIKNLTVKNATIVGNSMVGAVASSLDNAVIDNCKAIDCTLIGVKKVGAVVGYSAGSTVTNNYAENCTVIYSEKEGGEILGYENTGSTVSNNTANNVSVNQGVAVSSADDLDTALAEGKNVVLSGDMNFDSSETTANSGYGATGVSVKGSVLDGNGHSLGINNWGTWDSAVHTTGGTIKNLKINSGMRGIFMGSATADVYIDNVIIDGTVYTFNSDGGSKDYGVYISNSTLNGWTSHSDVHKEVVYTNCNFGEGSGYAYCRPYGPTTFKNCAFAAGFEVEALGQVTFENCTIGGVALTADNLATLVTGGTIANATVR